MWRKELPSWLGNSVGYNIFTPATYYYLYNRTSNTISSKRNYWPASPPTICTPLPTKVYGPAAVDSALCSEPALGPSSLHVASNDERAEPTVPTRFNLKQNYPNPFNPTTTISYDVPRPGGRVELAIYDVAGRLVTILVNEHRPAARYVIHWDGRDRRGQPVASGVYFLRMRAAQFNVTKKLLLLR
jgi:FlgD Ig-like domain